MCVYVGEIDFLTKPHSLRHEAIEIACCFASCLYNNTHKTWSTDSKGGHNIDGVEFCFFLTCKAACNGATGGLSPACRSALCHSPDRPISAEEKNRKSGINLQHFTHKRKQHCLRDDQNDDDWGQLRNPFSAVSQQQPDCGNIFVGHHHHHHRHQTRKSKTKKKANIFGPKLTSSRLMFLSPVAPCEFSLDIGGYPACP